MNVTAGKEVKEGDVLVQLDDTDLQAQARQAQAQLAQAKAAAEQAQWDFDRQSKLAGTGSITEQEFLHTRTNNDRAKAAVTQAEQALKYAQATLSWAVILSPINGVVVDKLVEAGDLVKPGQTLVRVYNRDKMQLVASVIRVLLAEFGERDVAFRFVADIDEGGVTAQPDDSPEGDLTDSDDGVVVFLFK